MRKFNFNLIYIIPIVAFLVIVVVLSGLWFFVSREDQVSPEIIARKCGNGLCDEREQRIGNCPADCSSETPTVGELPTTVEPEEPYSNPDIRNRSLVVDEVSQSKYFTGNQTECGKTQTKEYGAGTDQSGFLETIPNDVGDEVAPIRFVIGVHVEPYPYMKGRDEYLKDADRLRQMAEIVSDHGGVMTVEVQRPFTTYLKEESDDLLSDFTDLGFEVALHIHEDFLIPNYLGVDFPGIGTGAELAENQSFEIWVAAIGNLKREVEALSGVPVTSFSGAPFFDERYQAAAELGLTVNYNFKDPDTQQADEELLVVNPWRPAGSESLDKFLQYDRNGAVIYIPGGVRPAHCIGIEVVPHPYSYFGFDFVTKSLAASLDSVDPDKINTFSILFHPNDFEETADDEAEFKVWDEWLTKVIDPLVADGRLVWQTFSETGEDYVEWEKENIGD